MPLPAGNTLWPLGDHLGTLRDLADFSGTAFTITNHRVFDTFGRLTSETNSAVECHFAFTGKFFDDLGDTELSTSLSHHWNRWYDPQLGKWLSEDPIGFAGGDVNLGRYVGNVPTVLIDSNGLDWVWPWDPRASWNPADTAQLWGETAVYYGSAAVDRIGNGVAGAIPGAATGAVVGGGVGAGIGGVVGVGVGAGPGAAAGATAGAIGGGIGGFISGVLSDPDASLGSVAIDGAISGGISGLTGGIGGGLFGPTVSATFSSTAPTLVPTFSGTVTAATTTTATTYTVSTSVISAGAAVGTSVYMSGQGPEQPGWKPSSSDGPIKGSGGPGKVYEIPGSELKTGKDYIGKTRQPTVADRLRSADHKAKTKTGESPKAKTIADELTIEEMDGVEGLLIQRRGLENLSNKVPGRNFSLEKNKSRLEAGKNVLGEE